MRDRIITLITVIIVVAALLVTFVPLVRVASSTVDSSARMTYMVSGLAGPTPINVTWSDVTGGPMVLMQYCNPGTASPGTGCTQPTFYWMGYWNAGRSGGWIGTIPVGAVLMITVSGSQGSSVHVTITVGAPSLGIAVLLTTVALIGLRYWIRHRRELSTDSPQVD